MDRTKTHTTADKGEPDVFTCPPPKTEKFVGKNENCPNCTKMLAETESGLLEQLTKGGALIKARKNSPTQNSGLRFKAPIFDGLSEPRHFMVKLRNFFEIYGIDAEREKIMILKSCLEGKALDFYLSLAENEQGNLALLDEKFQDHFRPKKWQIRNDDMDGGYIFLLTIVLNDNLPKK